MKEEGMRGRFVVTTVVPSMFSNLLNRNKAVMAAGLASGVVVGATCVGKSLLNPSRRYERDGKSVVEAYDAWTSEGIVEHYWGEHVHLGYYSDEEQKNGMFSKNFKQAKVDFINEMAKFGKLEIENPPKRILDLGCGIGGTTRQLSKMFGPKTQIIGISISPNQISRAQKLTEDQNLTKTCSFRVMDAAKLEFAANLFDVVWVCESTEHMPNKQRVIDEITRVLKPGGRLIIAVWSQRDDRQKPFDAMEKRRLQFLYDQWSHPPFISVNAFKDLLNETGMFSKISSENWTKQTLPSWYHQILLGLTDPLPWITRPK